MSDYAVLDEALEVLASAGPDLRNGMSNHAPMAVEALCALGRSDAALPWLVRASRRARPVQCFQAVSCDTTSATVAISSSGSSGLATCVLKPAASACSRSSLRA